MPRRSIEDLLAKARSGLQRLSPQEAAAAIARDALLVDIRSDRQREEDGHVPGALHIPRNVLEWRVDVMGRDRHVILMCDEGYQSSLAAATLQELGIARATDMDGGFRAWRAAGLPVERA